MLDIVLDVDAIFLDFNAQLCSVSAQELSNPGVCCLRSSQTEWDEAILWRTYFTLTDLEAVFRC